MDFKTVKSAISDMEDDDFLEIYKFIGKLYVVKKIDLIKGIKTGFNVGDKVMVIEGNKPTKYSGLAGVISKKNPRFATIAISLKMNPRHKDIFSGKPLSYLKCPYILLKNIEE